MCPYDYERIQFVLQEMQLRAVSQPQHEKVSLESARNGAKYGHYPSVDSVAVVSASGIWAETATITGGKEMACCPLSWGV